MPAIMADTEKRYNYKFGRHTLFVGEKGLFSSEPKILPEDKHKEFPEPPTSIPRAYGGPIEDLLHAYRHGGTPCSNFVGPASQLTAFVLTGLLAMFAGVGEKLEWDVEKMQCTNLPKINQYVRREYRRGWEV
jgi:hypothetical protein